VLYFELCLCSMKPNCIKSDNNERGILTVCKSSSSLFGAGAAVFEVMCFRLAFGSSASQACGSKFSILSLRVTGIGIVVVVVTRKFAESCCCVPLLLITYLHGGAVRVMHDTSCAVRTHFLSQNQRS